MRFFHFISYHNAIPIAFGILFLGATGVFAATNPEAIFDSEESVVSVDNTYIASKNLDSFTPTVQITEVTEDDDFYYVAYRFTTIDLADYVWQDVIKNETMKVSKDSLGQYRDLGLYAMEQLQQKIEREVAYLKEVQGIEKKNVSLKRVATAYSGLVGAIFSDTTETLAGYIPVVTPPVPPQRPQVASAAGSQTNSSGQQSSTSNSVNGSGSPVIQILGNNPAWIKLKTRYSDLGAVVTDDKDLNLGLDIFFDGQEVNSVDLDTSTTSQHQVLYRATDKDGNIAEATRTIVVYDPLVESPPEVTSNTSTPPSSAPNTSTQNSSTSTESTTNDTSATNQQATSPDSSNSNTTPAATSTESGTTEAATSTAGATGQTPSAATSTTATTETSTSTESVAENVTNTPSSGSATTTTE